MSSAILDLHTHTYSPARLDALCYEQMRNEILRRLAAQEMPFRVLLQQLVHDLQDTFDGPIIWYATTVRHDLEKHGDIEKSPCSYPARLRVKQV